MFYLTQSTIFDNIFEVFMRQRKQEMGMGDYIFYLFIFSSIFMILPLIDTLHL